MSFKALRRSRDAKATHSISTPLSANGGTTTILSKPASAKSFIPNKVIRAIDSRRATAPQELSFSKGDFFYVTKDVDFQSGGWFEAHNPNTGARGLVPRDAFEELGKQSNTPRTPSFPMMQNAPGPMSPPLPRALSGMPATAPSTTTRHVAYFAIVQYDFSAERPDELDAKAGEAISVVAQSNREWFVAKPIGRLGGPGLIPVSFVELREPQSGRKMTEQEVNEAMDKGTLPKVEVWKKATMDYKQSSIPLGVIDAIPAPSSTPSSYNNGGFSNQQTRSGSTGGSGGYASQHQNEEPPLEDEEDLLPPGIPIQASIPSFHQETGEYWFRVDIRYQPDLPNEYDDVLPQQVAMVLYRNYDDFYAFQLDLLDTWPVEAGREKRDPNDPTPLLETDRILPFMPGPVDEVTDAVTVERRHDLDIYVHELIALADPPTNADYILRCDLVRRFFSQKAGDVILPPPVTPAPASPVPSQAQARPRGSEDRLRGLNGLSLHDDDERNRMSRGSAYSDHKSQRSMRSHGNHQTRGSVSSYDGGGQTSPTQSNAHSTGRYSPTLTHAGTDVSAHTTANSSAGPQSAFLKVKIFHSNSDDLIAIRVSPRITHSQLLEKVRDRLGSEITTLRYSEKGTPMTQKAEKELITIMDDEDLRGWVADNSKLVLYAY